MLCDIINIAIQLMIYWPYKYAKIVENGIIFMICQWLLLLLYERKYHVAFELSEFSKASVTIRLIRTNVSPKRIWIMHANKSIWICNAAIWHPVGYVMTVSWILESINILHIFPLYTKAKETHTPHHLLHVCHTWFLQMRRNLKWQCRSSGNIKLTRCIENGETFLFLCFHSVFFYCRAIQ